MPNTKGSFDLSDDHPAHVQGHQYLLAIGIDQYEDDKIANLHNAVRDVTDFVELMKTRYGFSGENATVEMLTDTNATRRNIHAKLQHLAEKVTQNDTCILYFSGHGAYNKTLEEGYWIPCKADYGEYDDYLPNAVVQRTLSAIKSHHTFLIVDSCYSGSMFTGSSKDISRLGHEPSRWGLTSGRNEIVSDGKPGENSPFAAELLRQLRQNDQPLGVVSLCAKMMEVVTANARQTPRGEPLAIPGHKGGQYIFRPVDAEATAWKTAEARNDLQGYAVFLEKYPESLRRVEAKARRAALQADTDWSAAETQHTEAAYDDFTEKHPRDPRAAIAEQRMEALADDRKWAEADRRGGLKDYKNYQNAYPNGRHAAEAEQAIKSIRKDGPLLPDNVPQQPVAAAASSITVPPQVIPAVQPPVPSWLAFVKGGSYTMGDVMDDKLGTDETPHTVTVSDFYISKYEVSFEEFDAFCTATRRTKPEDSRGWGRGTRPVIKVDWYDALEYCNWRSQQDGLTPCYTIDKTIQDPNSQNTDDTKKWAVTCSWTANGYRLPTEAEWEYAAREGGKKVRFGNGRDLIDPTEVNFNARSEYKKDFSIVGECRQKTVPVNDLSDNPLGLKNMSGNVWEWCWDWYGEKYYTESEGVRNPRGATSSNYRVLRGGSWLDLPEDCRASYRDRSNPINRVNDIGFRLARGY
jgi:formylglycine-generating enzyme required for sulfatase activity